MPNLLGEKILVSYYVSKSRFTYILIVFINFSILSCPEIQITCINPRKGSVVVKNCILKRIFFYLRMMYTMRKMMTKRSSAATIPKIIAIRSLLLAMSRELVFLVSRAGNATVTTATDSS